VILAALLLTVMGWSGQTGTIVVAHDNAIDGFDRTGEKKMWSAKGLESPSAIAVSPDGSMAVVLDGFANRVALVTLADGAVEFHETPATPLAAVFFGRDAWIILRDRSSVMRLSDQKEVPVALDPAFIVAGVDNLYVYSRAEGVLQEIDPKAAAMRRTVETGSGGSDLEIRRYEAFVCRPMVGKIAAIDLLKMTSRDIPCGETPMDVAFDNVGTSYIADPTKQIAYVSKDPGEGRPVNLPTPADRIVSGGAGAYAFDSNCRTIYRISGHIAGTVATGVDAFVSTDKTLFWWDAKSGKLLH
jgi:DNA-binding beta-propeller fold protein YncE